MGIAEAVSAFCVVLTFVFCTCRIQIKFCNAFAEGIVNGVDTDCLDFFRCLFSSLFLCFFSSFFRCLFLFRFSFTSGCACCAG